MPFYLRINQLLYDQVNDRLVMYDFTRNKLARFDFKTQIWTNEQDTFSLPHFMHHSKYYDETNKMIYTFGGYGFHQFSALLQQYSESSQQWESFDLSGDINPRYLGAMGVLNDSLLLYFGGHGNISGKQYEAPHNYYDLYTINIRTRNIQKIWEFSDVDNHFTNSNSLVVNNTSQTFYTLSHPNNIYETQLFLHEYKLNAPEFRTLGNPIPFLFNDVDAYCNLFIPADSTELFAVVSYATGKKSIIDIYSIAYPPLGIEGISQTESKINPALYLLFYVALFIIIALLIYFITKRVRKTMHIRSVLKTIDLKTNEAKDHLGKAIDDEADKPPFPAINVLNVFEVLDSKGANITNLFSPAISRIFLLLYFKTLENGKGVTSSELGRILWPDKDYESIRNNKNVYFHKLRPILSMIGNIQLTQTNDFWALLYDNETIYSDYEQVMKNIAILRKKPELDKELLKEVLKIAKKGELLSFDEFEWLDVYKANYANTIIEFLSELTAHPDVKNDYPLLFDIAKVILIQDNIEEFGIKLKCSILYKLGKKKQALQCYNKYVEEYVTVLNTKPELTFDKII
ncbi:hypothetical protein FACS189423_07690 [Bacteroidia bacterium]|nr:hypothetical protein FACS189423_07690 [Bacteroidia bacterium]